MNQLVLSARILELAAVRYTPAGLPALDLMLTHESQAEEAGARRKVALEIKAVAVGEIVKRVQALGLTEAAVFTGFLSAQRQGRGTVFHITAVDR
ncbi:primosomal replication protein N [Roseateles depolymerans]|uniref:Primosomal replication protein N n=1 Tax=Roseateles depolymerans TaxID=76731 RepID=A0A0U3N1B7_9BURK|nr:primosomal replication protein N [Roseateles depolymerans]ALV06011.1 Primosomal replication protein N [Roseateles depolymerans]REG12013.1 restart primosome assembly protein PriB [Roseateles depolymerans]